MRFSTVNLFALILLGLPVTGDNLLRDPGFEEGKSFWKAIAPYGTRAGFEKSPNAHSGAHVAHLSTYLDLARFGSFSQETEQLPAGIYEFTTWAKGTGKLRLSVEKIGMRAFNLSDAEWLQYSYVFELTETKPVTLCIEVQGNALVDDAALVAADELLKVAWDHQQKAFAQFYYIPSGYSAQRPAPNAPRESGIQRNPIPITDKVVFYDPRYDTAWNTNCDLIAEWFARRGFVAKNVRELGEWMQSKIEKGAYGSVVVMGMGLVPKALIEPLSERCLLRRYMDAGGRVVWTGDTALYVAQGETGPIDVIGEAGMSNLLNMTCDWGMWGGAPHLTEAGKRWGLRAAGTCLRGARRSEVTLSLSEDSATGSSAIWLKTTNPEYPLSGFIASVFALDGKDTKALEEFYRLALFSGEPVAIPEPAPVKTSPASFSVSLITYGNGVERRAFVSGERVSIEVKAASAVPTTDAVMRIALFPNAPRMSVYDMADIGIKEKQAELAAYHLRAAKLKPVWSQTAKLSLQPGKESRAEVFTLNTQSLPIGDYELRAVLNHLDGTVAAQTARPLAVCRMPRVEGIYYGARGPSPTNAYRLAAYLDEISRLNLHGIEMGPPPAKVADAMLRQGLTFIPYVDARPYLTENKKDRTGKDVPNPWGGGKPGLKGVAGQKAREDTRAGMEKLAKAATVFPACSNVFTTSDDYSALGGWDWTQANLDEFKAKTGLDAPREPTAKPGIIPDDDPWLLWNRFLCKDVLGGLNTAIRAGVQAGSPGAQVWPVPGGAQWPLFMLSSGQYPPMNFGKEWGLNAPGYYCYLTYWCPSLAYLYWSEVARMGNRDLPVWAMPNASDSRHYLRNQAHLLLAAGTKGIVYFTYDWMGTEGKKEIAEIGALLKKHGRLLASLKPAPKDVALLVPFSQACYNDTYPLNLIHTFANLLQAHIHVEPIAEEEIAVSRYKVILVSDVTHLAAATVAALESFIQRGGKVVLDRDCRIEIAGAIRLDVGLAQGNEKDGVSIHTYARPARIEAVRAALAPHVSVSYDSPEITTIIRPFVDAGGHRYAYVVQVDDNEEYTFYRRNVYEVATFGKEPAVGKEELNRFLTDHGMNSNLQDTTITVLFDASLLPKNGKVMDVFTGQIFNPEPAGGGRMKVTVKTRRFGGALLLM